MGLFDTRSMVEKYEDEFKKKELDDKKIFFELNIRGGDPEDVRTTAVEYFEDMDYAIYVNKFTRFENPEFESLFKSGRLKPLRSILKAEKEVEVGTMFPLFYKIVAIIGLLISSVYFFPESWFEGIVFSGEYFAIGGIVLVFSSIILWSVRRTDVLRIWFKMAGVYNVEDEKSDFNIIISADSTSNDKEIIEELDEEVSEIYRGLSRKYKKKVTKKPVKIEIPKKEKKVDVKIIKRINEIEKDINNLDARLARGEISESTYNDVKANLNERKRKFETILDLLNV